MPYEADRVVVELLAKVDNFDTPVKTSATTFDANMNKITASATKAEQAVVRSSANRASAIQRESAQISQFSRQLSGQLNDVGALLSSPRSPFVAPVKAAPKVSQAFGLVQAGAAAMGGVMGGIALQAAVALGSELLTLILRTNDAEDAVNDLVQGLKDHAEKTELSRRAADIFAQTQEGVHDSLLRAEDARQKAEDGLRSYGESANLVAKKNLEIIDSNLRAAESYLELAKAQAAAANQTNFGAAGGAGAAAAQSIYSQQVEDIEKSIAKLKADRKGFEAELVASRADLAEEAAKRAADPIARLNDQYDREVEAAKKAAIATGKVTTELTKQITAIERRRSAALKAARDVDKVDNSNRQSGRRINLAEARRIVEGIGGTVTSGLRSPEHNKDVGGVPNSFHTKGQALDIAKTAGLTLGKIVKAFEAQGVRLIEKLDEGDHFHIAFARRGSGRQGPSAETLARRAAAAAEKEANREQAFDNEKAGLEGQVIDARQALVESAEGIAQLERDSIELARAKYADQVAHLQSIGKLQEGEATELIKLNDERAKLRTELVNRREDERKFRMREAELQRQQTVQQGAFQAQTDLLQSQQAVANTARERRDISQRLLDLQFAEERALLQAAIAREARLKAEYDRTKSQQTLAELEQAQVDAALARQQLATIDQRQGNANTENTRQNASPLQAYFTDIQAQANDLDTAFEQIAAGGLATFTDALTDAIVNFTSLGDVGRAVLASITAQLVRMAIQQVLLHTVGRALGMTATAATAAQAAAVAAAWAPAAAAASLATLGTNAGPAAAALASTNALSYALALGGPKAQGGRITGPGGPMSDSILTPSSNGEFMIKTSSAQRLGYDTLDYMNRTGSLPGGMAGGGAIGRVRPSNDVAASPGGRGGGFSQGDRQFLAGELRRAMETQSPIHLYPTTRPEQALQQALGTPGGRRVMFEFFNDNPRAIRSNLEQ